MLLKTAQNPNNAIKTTFENMISCFYLNFFGSSFIESVCMFEQGYGKIVHCTTERDLACRGAKTSEHILTLSHMQMFYDTFDIFLVMQQLASNIKTPTMQQVDIC